MPGIAGIKVHGLRELNRAFARADATLKNEMKDRLKEATEPARAEAERLAGSEITNIGKDWPKMRIGVTQRVVYIAPVERGIKTRAPQRSFFFGLIRVRGPLGKRRPNLATLLLEKAMEPALESNRAQIERDVQRFIDDIGRDWERA